MKGLAALLQKFFFWKVPTAIFINIGPCKLVRTENDITSSKIIIFQGNWNRRCILILSIDLCKQKLKIWKNPRFFSISGFFSNNLHFGKFGNEIPDRDTLYRTYVMKIYKATPFSFTLQKTWRLYRSFFSRYDWFSCTYDFHLNHIIFA